MVSRYFNQGFIGVRLRASVDEVIEGRERTLEQYFHSTFTAAVFRTVAHAIPWLSPDPLLLAFVTDIELWDAERGATVPDGPRESFLTPRSVESRANARDRTRNATATESVSPSFETDVTFTNPTWSGTE